MLARTSGRGRRGFQKVGLLIKMAQADRAIDRRELHDVIWVRRGREDPEVILPARKDIGMDTFASDKDVLFQRRYRAIVLEFSAAVVRLRWRVRALRRSDPDLKGRGWGLHRLRVGKGRILC